jgi:hypothetical protein
MRTPASTTEYELRLGLGKALNDLRTDLERCKCVGTPGVTDAKAEHLLAAAARALEGARQAAELLEALDVLTLEAQWMLAYLRPTFDTIERSLKRLQEGSRLTGAGA